MTAVSLSWDTNEKRHNDINPHQRNSKKARAHDSEHVCVKRAQSGKLSFSNRFIVFVYTGENVAKTL